jgi:hypothetical protein
MKDDLVLQKKEREEKIEWLLKKKAWHEEKIEWLQMKLKLSQDNLFCAKAELQQLNDKL